VIADLKDWAWVAQFLSLVLVPLLLAYLKGIFADKAAVERLAKAHAEFETRMSLAEERIAEAPTQRDFAQLRQDFLALHGDIKTLTAKLDGFRDLFVRAEATVDRMHAALLKDNA
jgi:hypothetical protein